MIRKLHMFMEHNNLGDFTNQLFEFYIEFNTMFIAYFQDFLSVAITLCTLMI